MKTILASILIIFLLSGCKSVVTEQPSSSQVILIPATPGPNYVWVGDSWVWNQRTHSYRASPGYWVKPKKQSAMWVDGHWVKARGGWRYVKGHWRHT